ncbi:MAG: SRPBCC domain-containing protein [Candidatus Zixiibacteriota bacterium]
MNYRYIKTILGGGIAVLFLVGLSLAADEGEREMPDHHQYFVRLLGTRADWPENMTADERKIMEEHFVYLQKLMYDKKVIMAGPVDRPPFGLIVLQTDSEDEAIEIMDQEPSVFRGVHTYEMQPMTISLLAENFSSRRYAPEPTDRVLTREKTVKAPLDLVWKLWTTTEGVKSFFASNADVDLRIGGPYEIYFEPSAPFGMRGSEDCRVLSFLPMEMLSFEWNAPPKFELLRREHTQVILQFEQLDPGQVKVRLSQLGWGRGEQWDQLYDYFDEAWSHVLDNFAKCTVDSPLKWQEEK